jgi:transaldolase
VLRDPTRSHSRPLLEIGEFTRLVRAQAVSGATANPTFFAKAITGSTATTTSWAPAAVRRFEGR